jgi:hypothetical protein
MTESLPKFQEYWHNLVKPCFKLNFVSRRSTFCFLFFSFQFYQIFFQRLWKYVIRFQNILIIILSWRITLLSLWSDPFYAWWYSFLWNVLFLFLSFFLWYWALNSGPTPWATPPALFSLWRVFPDRVLWTICPGRLQTMILLISASWVARITTVSHWCPAEIYFFWY